MPALTPTNPADVMVTRQVIPNVITTFSVPFWRFGRIKFGGRGTVVRLQSGNLAVFSPVALTPEVKETISTLGEVKYITALDFEHHIFLGPWHQAYPNAKVIGPEGLYEKRQKQGNEDVPFTTVFTKENRESVQIDPEFDAEFDYEYFYAHPNKEIAFNHKPTRTLIQADLVFNLPAKEQFSKTNEDPTTGVLTQLFSYFNNTVGEAIGQRRFIWFISRRDRPGFNQSVAKVRQWDFDRIIPCHGDTIETGGKGIYETVMAWHFAEGEGKKST